MALVDNDDHESDAESLYSSSPELLDGNHLLSLDEDVIEDHTPDAISTPVIDMFDMAATLANSKAHIKNHLIETTSDPDLCHSPTDPTRLQIDELLQDIQRKCRRRQPSGELASSSCLGKSGTSSSNDDDHNASQLGSCAPLDNLFLDNSSPLSSSLINKDAFLSLGQPSPPDDLKRFMRTSTTSLFTSLKARKTSLSTTRKMSAPLTRHASLNLYPQSPDSLWTNYPSQNEETKKRDLDEKSILETSREPPDLINRTIAPETLTDREEEQSDDYHRNGFAIASRSYDSLQNGEIVSPGQYYKPFRGQHEVGYFDPNEEDRRKILNEYENYDRRSGPEAHIFVNGGHNVMEKDPFIGTTTSIATDPQNVWIDPNMSAYNSTNTDPINTYNDPYLEQPRDRFNLIYLTFVLHGIGTLMPWNMFITAKEYFVDYKLAADYNRDSGIPYATYFLQYIGFAAQVPNVIFNWLNIFLSPSGSLTSRIVWTLMVEVVLFVVTIVLAMVDSRGWAGIFFYLTIFSVIVLNMVNGIYQNTVYGLASKLPFKYTGAVVLGSNLSGTIVSIINLISIYMAPNPRTAAIYYFITALFILLACFDTYFALPLNRFFRYHDHMYNHSLHEKRRRNVIHAIPYWTVFKKSFSQCFNVFFTFFVTLTIFPAIHADIQASDKDFFISPKYFSAWTCFFTFNVSAVIGNLLPSVVKWPSRRWLFIPVLVRFLLVPFFLLCNYRPVNVERLWPVLFHWDWAYWTASIVLGLTGGYFSSMAMMYCPRSVEPEYASVAGMFGAASIVTGIFAGIGFSYVMPTVISHPDLNFEEPSWWPKYSA